MEAVNERWLPLYQQTAAQRFEQDRRHVQAIVDRVHHRARQQSSSIQWEAVQDGWEVYLQQAGDQWREAFIPVLGGTVIDASREYHQAYGMTFNAVDVVAADWFNEYTLKFAQDINATTKSDISAVMQQAILEGWSVSTMQKNLDTVFNQYVSGSLSPEDFKWFKERMPAYRTEMIARTEVVGASNLSAFRTAKSWGAQYKSWLATMDSRTRFSHVNAYADYGKGGKIGPIPIDEHFLVNGVRMMQPGDKSAPAGEIVNCRCTVLSWFGDELSDKPQVQQATYRNISRSGDVEEYDQTWDTFFSQLTREQKWALGRYTGYSGFAPINAYLRGEKTTEVEFGEVTWNQLQAHLKEIDSAFRHPSARLQEDLMLWRGTDLEGFGFKLKDFNDPIFRSNLIGIELQDKAFVSTSLSESFGEGWGGQLLLKIRAPAGTPAVFVRRVSQHDYEDEILLGRGSRFRVVDVVYDPDSEGKPVQLTVEVIND